MSATPSVPAFLYQTYDEKGGLIPEVFIPSYNIVFNPDEGAMFRAPRINLQPKNNADTTTLLHPSQLSPGSYTHTNITTSTANKVHDLAKLQLEVGTKHWEVAEQLKRFFLPTPSETKSD